MKIGTLIKGIVKNSERLRRDPNLPDDVTTDGYLKSLRRQRRVQMEQVEKKLLIKKIRDFNNQQNSKMLVSKGILSSENKMIPKKHNSGSLLSKGKI